MSIKNALFQLALFPIKILLSVKKEDLNEFIIPKNILVIWMDVSFGILISSRSFFQTLRNKYPDAKIKLVLSRNTKQKLDESKLTFNNFFDEYISRSDLRDIFRLIRRKSDLSIVPTLGNFRFINYLLMRITKSQHKVGISKFDSRNNPFDFLINSKIEIDFSKSPDNHISQILFENLTSLDQFVEQKNITLNYNRLSEAAIDKYKSSLGFNDGKKIIIINLETEKEETKISPPKYIDLVKQLSAEYGAQFCFIDNEAKCNFAIIENSINESVLLYTNKNVKLLFNLLSFADLVITCDSEFMHIAGAINVPQLSLFGVTNPFKLSPIGKNKIFLKKSDLIDDIETSDIINECNNLIDKW